MFAPADADGRSSFLPLEQHRVVAISTLLRNGDQFQVWSLGAADSPEDDLIRRFFGGIDKLRPTLVSWNGSGFDLPVLHYRMLRHGIVVADLLGHRASATATSAGTTTSTAITRGTWT